MQWIRLINSFKMFLKMFLITFQVSFFSLWTFLKHTNHTLCPLMLLKACSQIHISFNMFILVLKRWSGQNLPRTHKSLVTFSSVFFALSKCFHGCVRLAVSLLWRDCFIGLSPAAYNESNETYFRVSPHNIC